MKAFIGKDIRYVVLSDGQPEGAMDMPDGRRAFQFRVGGGAVTYPGWQCVIRGGHSHESRPSPSSIFLHCTE